MTMLRVLGVVSCLSAAAALPEAKPDDIVEFSVTIRQRNLEWLANEWDEVVSQVKGKRWRAFSTIDEVNAMVGASPEDFAAAAQWADTHNFSVLKSFPDFMVLSASVAAVRTAFPTLPTLYKYGRSVSVQSPPPLLPLPPFITSIHGLHKPSTSRRVRLAGTKQESISPQTVKAQYGITPPTGTVIGNVSVAQMSFCPVSLEDCNEFCKEGGLNCSLEASHVTGPTSSLKPCGEADMDVQMVYSSGPGVSLYVDGGYSSFEEWASAWFNNPNGVMVASLSYGSDETTKEATSALNTELQKLGVTGRAVFVSSGDAGADGSGSSICGIKFKPSWPATSPYVTAVGATESQPGSAPHLPNPSKLCNPQLVGPCVGKGIEEAVSLNVSMFSSGGGFSGVYDLQTWQADVVKAYLASGVKLPPSEMWNAQGRGFPDVAAFGGQNLVVTDRVVQQGGGTSASSPLWAGVYGLMNSASFKKTGKPLGPAAPYLYHVYAQAPQCFTDITIGDNTCPTAIVNDCSECHGFYTAKGWDPVTGLGTPNVECLLNFVEADL